MHHDYHDITSRIKEDPAWYDQNGVPRYGKHSPDACPDIYAREVILLKIECQSCHRPFMVQMSTGPVAWIAYGAQGQYKENGIARAIKAKAIHYGDPPIHGCVGDTMNSDPIRIIEYWRKARFEWRRLKTYEIDLE